MKHARLLFLFFTFSLHAQFQINGIVKDGTSNLPLPFATITANGGINTISDVDGKFTLATTNELTQFEVSYIGFSKTTVFTAKNKSYYWVAMGAKTTDLAEIKIANSKQALALIQKVIANKNNNNPQVQLQSFDFKSYTKLLVTANPDSIRSELDSVFIVKSYGKKFVKIDSSNYKFKEIIKQQHLFQTEKVSQFQFNNHKLKETILGTKMAGFKQPIYEILGFNLQSFSIYDLRYELFETKYNSPIATDAPNEYNFKLLDSVIIDGRPTAMVYFKKKRKAAGLEGVLYIDTQNFAVAKAVMRIKGVLDISGVHTFTYIPQVQLWFPNDKIFKIVKGKNDDDIKILGGTIQFDGDVAKDFKTRKKQASDYTYLLSQTHNFDIKYNQPITIKKASIFIEVKDDAINKPESFWEHFRKDSLDARSQKTYSALDSLSVKRRIESRLTLGRKILNGYLPVGFVDLNLRKFISFNNYEGFRVGAGGITNDHFSKILKMEGYTAYGIKDGKLKYNLGIGTRLGKFSNSWIGISYTDDVKEIGSTTWSIDKRAFKIYDPRPINISTFYNYVSWKGVIETKIIPKTESVWELSQTVVTPKFNYLYNLNGKLYDNYTLTTAMVSLRWSPFSDYMQTPSGRIEVEKRFPKFTFQITQSLPKIANNDFEFSKFDFRTEYEKKYLNGQKTNLLFEAGYALGDLPITHLYNTAPNNLTKETVLQRITFSGKNSFETMYFNEFFSSKFAFFQFKHGFSRVVIFKKIKPSLVLVSRMAWGAMEHPEQHVGIEYKTLKDGFFESGIELNQIYKGLGLSGFYRYGPNQLSKFEDNIAVKISFVIDLGL
ncbi:DUF5686 family protein [Flavobacterium restrictum]|uniref:Carboxypeptidase-like regulatory domain-containing protein n=1 Tax=Flavobacterium restrictum TaxID=2594428 RepID=A0A553DYE4_9FLAO|nr:DUF5686 family protein [Flavobacterium restrictum]TRX37740.1 carboxypeptidase-like regulatory domain-containing protein [Flavobacterium restrictum]